MVSCPSLMSEQFEGRLSGRHQSLYDIRPDESPAGFEAGDANLYRYVGNAPTMYADPTGLSHHPIPRAVWPDTGFDSSVFTIWDDPSILIDQPQGSGHNYTAHGGTEGYAAHVRDLLQEDLEAYRCKNGGNGTVEQQRNFAKSFRDKILNMPKNSFIGGFNDAVRRGGTAGVKNWYQRVGSKLARPTARSVVDAVGLAETIRDGVDAVNGNTAYETYYFKDDGGIYCYMTNGLAAGFNYSGTNRHYVSGPKAGENVPTSYIRARAHVFWKSIFDRPSIPSLPGGGIIQ